MKTSAIFVKKRGSANENMETKALFQNLRFTSTAPSRWQDSFANNAQKTERRNLPVGKMDWNTPGAVRTMSVGTIKIITTVVSAVEVGYNAKAVKWGAAVVAEESYAILVPTRKDACAKIDRIDEIDLTTRRKAKV